MSFEGSFCQRVFASRVSIAYQRESGGMTSLPFLVPGTFVHKTIAFGAGGSENNLITEFQHPPFVPEHFRLGYVTS